MRKLLLIISIWFPIFCWGQTSVSVSNFDFKCETCIEGEEYFRANGFMSMPVRLKNQPPSALTNNPARIQNCIELLRPLTVIES